MISQVTATNCRPEDWIRRLSGQCGGPQREKCRIGCCNGQNCRRANGTSIFCSQRVSGSCAALNLLFENESLKIWDDFAHHPTAIANTLTPWLTKTPLIAVIELRSNTMKAGVHREALAASAACADFVYWVLPETTTWDTSLLSRSDGTSVVVRDVLVLETQLVQQASGQIIFMSNGGFSGIQSRW